MKMAPNNNFKCKYVNIFDFYCFLTFFLLFYFASYLRCQISDIISKTSYSGPSFPQNCNVDAVYNKYKFTYIYICYVYRILRVAPNVGMLVLFQIKFLILVSIFFILSNFTLLNQPNHK